MCIQKNFLCKNENQNKPNGASPPIPSLGGAADLTKYAQYIGKVH